FVCENNLYMEYTATDTITAGAILDRPRAMGIPSYQVDGNDVWAVQAATADALGRARNNEGPTFLEAMTYRLVGHSRSDPGRYRPAGELDRWRERDPLVVAAAWLRDAHGLAEDDVAAIDGSVEAEIRSVSSDALAAPFPEALELSEFKVSAGS
ncbi:MAG: acetoin:2,6-dichlorophenolindophenol oxidoreductase subunit alpha, partial [Gaiellales bacterium]|nr:acetoin:2,6-dichlorophenolindophenol oxidoreductase subunit alpha [Gaiellales bacterium]